MFRSPSEGRLTSTDYHQDLCSCAPKRAPILRCASFKFDTRCAEAGSVHPTVNRKVLGRIGSSFAAQTTSPISVESWRPRFRAHPMLWISVSPILSSISEAKPCRCPVWADHYLITTRRSPCNIGIIGTIGLQACAGKCTPVYSSP